VVEVHLVSALSHGNKGELEAAFGMSIHQVKPGDEAVQKADYVRQLGAERCVAVGNGRNDVRMFEVARLSIAVLGGEGTAVQAALAADVVARSCDDALDLLLNQRRLLATLRS